ncbi:hypothetical protein Q9251_17170 [Alkalihalobacillus macyae]|uniref:hypothetical protein n=1 Tax=Guptibacillus hwajinpoensis TaxID=208199 RepID=UPI00273B88F2|nr:hypothetical protein [Alkalihalobacillus macyae]MDP4552612.1 hypothetical protein [Alkalihalobacillus macyae]
MNSVNADLFSGATDAQIVQAAIDFAYTENMKTVELTDRDYIITSKIIIKEGVKLQFGYGSRFVIYGNFNVIELERGSSLSGAYIAIDDTRFNSAVIYLDGKYKYYNVWWRSIIENITIVNWSESHKGTGLYLYSNGPGHAISFVDFENVKMVGLKTGIKLEAVKASSGFSYVNANRFTNFSLDDCVNNIVIIGGETIPFECTGNYFKNLQIQPTNATTKLFVINGQYNYFDGLIWDLSVIPTPGALVNLTVTSSANSFNMKGIPRNRISDNGNSNELNLLFV